MFKSTKSTKNPEGTIILDYTDLFNNVDLYDEIEVRANMRIL